MPGESQKRIIEQVVGTVIGGLVLSGLAVVFASDQVAQFWRGMHPEHHTEDASFNIPALMFVILLILTVLMATLTVKEWRRHFRMLNEREQRRAKAAQAPQVPPAVWWQRTISAEDLLVPADQRWVETVFAILLLFGLVVDVLLVWQQGGV